MSNLRDLSGEAHLIHGLHYKPYKDRLNLKNEAMLLINGYFKIPSGHYFQSNEFSITAWVKLIKRKRFQVLLNFENKNGRNKVMFGFKNNFFSVFTKQEKIVEMTSQTRLNMNEWYFYLFQIFFFFQKK